MNLNGSMLEQHRSVTRQDLDQLPRAKDRTRLALMHALEQIRNLPEEDRQKAEYVLNANLHAMATRFNAFCGFIRVESQFDEALRTGNEVEFRSVLDAALEFATP